MSVSPAPVIVAESPSMRRVLDRARAFAAEPVPILIVGPTGTGKEVIAEFIHYHSARRGALVDVNCSTLQGELAEAKLFGHRKGAFTGAIGDAPGLIPAAARGTLFLDELCSLPLDVQAKLLRVLETKEVRPLGAVAKQWVDFRLLGAAQENLEARIDDGRFRADLYYRIAGLRIDIPALRDRPVDIIPLAEHFAAARGTSVAPEAHPVLLTYPWPGNTRELRMAIERAAHLAGGSPIGARALRASIGKGRSGGRRARDEATDGFRIQLQEALTRHGWNYGRVAATMGMSVATLYRRLGAAGISPKTLALSHVSHDVDDNGEHCGANGSTGHAQTRVGRPGSGAATSFR